MKAIEQIDPVAIIHSGKHAFIEASAGSGKTTLLTDLFHEIIASEKAQVQEILCVTFTEKAAAELKARIFSKLAKNSQNPSCRRAEVEFANNNIGTIHSFCLKSLRLSPSSRLIAASVDSQGDEEIFEQAREWVYRVCWSQLDKRLLSRLLDVVNFGSGGADRQFDRDLKQKALWCFANAVTPLVPYVEDIAGVTDGASFRAWTILMTVRKMQELAAQKNQLTYSLMVTQLAAALEEQDFVATLRKQFRFALIDEFQDTDEVQWRIFRKLFLDVPDSARLVVVGDPKQAIYKFRGADVFVYLKARAILKKHGAYMAQLGVNYRGNRAIIEFQNCIFQTKKIADVWKQAEITYQKPKCARESEPASNACVEIFFSGDFRAQQRYDFAAAAVARIAELQSEYPDWTFAVIAYRHRSLEIFAEALRAARIEFSYYNQQPNFQRIEVLHLKHLLNSLSLDFEEGRAIAETTLFLKNRPDALAWYQKIYQHGREGRIASLLTLLGQDAHAMHRILSCGGDATHFSSWRTLIQTLFAACGKSIYDLDSLLQYLDALEKGDAENLAAVDLLREPSAVTLLTVQSAKGLDWNAVVIADGHNDSGWNHFAFYHDHQGNAVVPAGGHEDFVARGDYQLHPDDEARITQLNLLYVALTRAKDRLLFFAAPHSRSQKPGPVAYFLSDPSEFQWPAGTLLRDLATVEPIKSTVQEIDLPAPEKVAHGSIPQRYRERTSYSALAEARFEYTGSHNDVLPRGKATGQLLHELLEHAELHLLADPNSQYARSLRKKITEQVSVVMSDKPELTEARAERIFGMLLATANAVLPLPAAGKIKLSALPAHNIWREMPFWSSAEIHSVLRKSGELTKRYMHGYMDMVFTADGQEYCILDYKSNSLADIDPAEIGQYVEEHYKLQAQIYTETLAAYLKTRYPNTRVAGFFFVFLRYLQPDSDVGVHFLDAATLLE